MIRINRPKDAPPSLQPDNVKNALDEIRKIARTKKPKSEDFPPHWGKEDVRRALWEMQYGKCCYCERLRDFNRESDIEHFRPKALVIGAGEGHKGYWWLAYTWTNLFFSCRHCNQEYKKNHFPVAKEEHRAKLETDDIRRENALLIDPSEDDAEEMLSYDWGGRDGLVWIQPRGGSEKGEQTIRLLQLNRTELLYERAHLVNLLSPIAQLAITCQNQISLRDEFRKAADQIRIETAAERPFAAFRRDFFKKRGLAEYVSRD
jgi:uncharacterized protein (TIGR02646 family)